MASCVFVLLSVPDLLCCPLVVLLFHMDSYDIMQWSYHCIWKMEKGLGVCSGPPDKPVPYGRPMFTYGLPKSSCVHLAMPMCCHGHITRHLPLRVFLGVNVGVHGRARAVSVNISHCLLHAARGPRLQIQANNALSVRQKSPRVLCETVPCLVHSAPRTVLLRLYPSTCW